ncbi:hypothetical protein F4778DRAFT_720775 [Xylariomycetidae sp. FL2044]|nr:hypothetical protein F4778DRAFT_720775 [Xylariomycetidae sp. FL2044]
MATAAETSAATQPATNDLDRLHGAFESYPWQMDRQFITQLYAALQESGNASSTLSDIALESRIQRFKQQTNLSVDKSAYKQWLSQGDRQQPKFVPEQAVVSEALSVPEPRDRKLAHLLIELGDPLGELALQQNLPEPDPSVPTWQSAAPRAALYVPRDNAAGAGGAPSDPGKEPYPKKFEEIVEFLQTGKEIPGIKQIPDTLIDDPAITAHGQLKAPPKPWEVRRSPEIAQQQQQQ